jgi:hypothetical protein
MANGDTVQSYGAIRTPLGAFQQQIALNERGEQLIATGLPRGSEMVRRGQAWGTMSTVAVAGLVVRPSTVAAFEIFNGYAAAGKSLVIDRLFFFNLVSAQVAQGWTGWACVTAAKAAVTSGSFVVRGASGKSYGGPVIAAASTTILDSGWFPWAVGSIKPVEATVTPNGGAVVDVDGRLIVPPQCSLCLHAVAQTTASTFTQGASWYEEQLTIE